MPCWLLLPCRYVGALVIAGLFTLTPDRLLGHTLSQWLTRF